MIKTIKKFYREKIFINLNKNFKYKNIQEFPRFEKIVINRGLGENAQKTKKLEYYIFELKNIATQILVFTKAKKAISSFKVRKKFPIGIKVTLREKNIYYFIDRMVNLVFPRIRDFKGINPKKFDGNGNYNMGIFDQLIFPEISYDQVREIKGINISIVTSTNKNEERIKMLKKIGIRFFS